MKMLWWLILFFSLSIVSLAEHEVVVPGRTINPYGEKDSNLPRLRKYLSGLKKFDALDDTERGTLLEKVRVALKPYVNTPMASCDGSTYEFSLEKNDQGVEELVETITPFSHGEDQVAERLNLPFRPLAIDKQWLYFEHPGAPNGYLTLYLGGTPKLREFQMGSVFLEKEKTECESPLCFQASSFGRCEKQMTSQIKRMLEPETVEGKLDVMKSNSAPLKSLKNFSKMKALLKKHGIEIPKGMDEVTLLHHPVLAAVTGLSAVQVAPEFQHRHLAPDPSVDQKTLQKVIGKNVIVTRYPIADFDKEWPDYIFHEWMHILDLQKIGYSLPDKQLAMQKKLQKQFESDWRKNHPGAKPAESETFAAESSNWVYQHSPAEQVAYASQIAYLRDAEGLSFADVQRHLARANGRHADATVLDSDTLALYKGFYDEKDLKKQLQAIQKAAVELAESD